MKERVRGNKAQKNMEGRREDEEKSGWLPLGRCPSITEKHGENGSHQCSNHGEGLLRGLTQNLRKGSGEGEQQGHLGFTWNLKRS